MSMTSGGGGRSDSARSRPPRARALAALVAGVCAASPAPAPELYRYRDESGAWVYTDRVPPGVEEVEREALRTAPGSGPVVRLRRVPGIGGSVALVAENTCPCPVQVAAWLTGGPGAAPPGPVPGEPVIALLEARATLTLLEIGPDARGAPPDFDFDYGYVLGDPAARHAPAEPYRPPFARAQAFTVSQAWPDAVTHDTPDSRHAVDLAMPIGTPIYAARAGVVATVAYGHFRGGLDRQVYGAQANHVRILHDDGTFGLYAHLRRDSVRVRPGQRVAAGEPIGYSGNTGFSSGPHLHFAVLRNAGLETVSEPVVFGDGRGGSTRPATGRLLENP